MTKRSTADPEQNKTPSRNWKSHHIEYITGLLDSRSITTDQFTVLSYLIGISDKKTAIARTSAPLIATALKVKTERVKTLLRQLVTGKSLESHRKTSSPKSYDIRLCNVLSEGKLTGNSPEFHRKNGDIPNEKTSWMTEKQSNQGFAEIVSMARNFGMVVDLRILDPDQEKKINPQPPLEEKKNLDEADSTPIKEKAAASRIEERIAKVKSVREAIMETFDITTVPNDLTIQELIDESGGDITNIVFACELIRGQQDGKKMVYRNQAANAIKYLKPVIEQSRGAVKYGKPRKPEEEPKIADLESYLIQCAQSQRLHGDVYPCLHELSGLLDLSIEDLYAQRECLPAGMLDDFKKTWEKELKAHHQKEAAEKMKKFAFLGQNEEDNHE